MREYIIPQEFNQADRIGSLTMVQAAILGIGVILIMFYVVTFGFLWALPLILVTAIATAYFMFAKKETLPIYEYIFVYFAYKSVPKELVYRTENIKELFLEDEIDIFEDEEVKRK